MRGIALLAAVIAPVSVACNNGTERARIDFERMRRQQRVSSYDASSAFVNGMAMRQPPTGSVSREASALGSSTATGRSAGGYVTRIPLDLTSDQRHQGAVDFGVYCAVCHGADGSGGTVVASNMRPPPPSLLASSARGLSPGQLFDIISNGRGGMPPFGWALPPTERWAVIATLESLQGSR